MSLPRRATLAVLALMVAGWLAGNLWSLERLEGAPAAVARTRAESGDAAAARAARTELKAARRFGDDAAAMLTQGRVLALLGRGGEAARLFAAAARREPENFDAWALLYATTRESDPARAERARRRAMALDPQARLGRP